MRPDESPNPLQTPPPNASDSTASFSPAAGGQVINPSGLPGTSTNNVVAPAQPFAENAQMPLSNPNNPSNPSMSSSSLSSLSPGSTGQYSSMNMGQPPQLPQKKSKKKFIIVAAVSLLVLGGSGAAAYFGYYVPNKPENIWRTALDRTGKGYDTLTEYISTEDRFAKGVKVDGSLSVKSKNFAASGSIKGASDSKGNSDFTGSVSASGLKVGVDFKTVDSPSDSPDLYFRVSGIQGLEQLLGPPGAEYEDLIKKVDNQWYFVDHTLIDKYGTAQGGLTLENDGEKTPYFSQKEVADLLKTVGEANKKYIFTSNTKDMAIEVKEEIGKEKQDGLNVYHYKIGIDKENLKKWNKEFCEQLVKTKIFEIASNGTSKDVFLRGCYNEDNFSAIDESSTADAWVDLKTKLIHKIRFTDSASNSRFDIFQNYTGGEKFPFGLAIEGVNGAAKLEFELNMDSGEIKMDGEAKIAAGNDAVDGTFNLNIAPNAEEVKVEKPDNAKNILQLLNDLGLEDILEGSVMPSPVTHFGGVQAKAKDTERQVDINALHSHLEAFFADKGYYPSFANLNDSAWRKVNMKGLDEGALKDPDGTSSVLTPTLKAKTYTYQVSPSGCGVNVDATQCTAYKLAAMLSDGKPFSKESLN